MPRFAGFVYVLLCFEFGLTVYNLGWALQERGLVAFECVVVVFWFWSFRGGGWVAGLGCLFCDYWCLLCGYSGYVLTCFCGL